MEDHLENVAEFWTPSTLSSSYIPHLAPPNVSPPCLCHAELHHRSPLQLHASARPPALVCICLDRYMAVVHPVLFTRIRDNKIRVGVSLVVWGLMLGYGITKSLMKVVSAAQVFSGLVLAAFIIMVFCNVSILWVLRRSVAGKEEMHPVKKKAFRMVLIILGIIVFNYLPPVALLPFASYFSFVEFRCRVSPSVFSLMDASSTVEPLLYITKMDMKDNGAGAGWCCRRRAAGQTPHNVKV
ncbi:unnamed protein product [Boreogadus saida]